MSEPLFIAVDLGAGSGRVFLAGPGADEFLLEEVRRFYYPPRTVNGNLRWDISHIFAEVKNGLRSAGERARQLQRPVESIGVDSWGVDYGLIDDNGNLVEDPICYRDQRTAGIMEEVFKRMPRERLFALTGIQFLEINTIFQLYAHARTGIPKNAARLLLIPDLINFLLTGREAAEYTNATTMQLVNASARLWDAEIIEKLDIPARLLAEIIPAGADLGLLKPDLAAELALEGVRVIAPATHDTGSAVAGTPLEEERAYISSGTWSLVGVELDRHIINDDAARHNFTNEGGALGSIRFLKNVMGLWIFESCRKEWKERGLDVDYDHLLIEAAAIDESPGLIFPDDRRFLNPRSMLEALAEQLNETGGKPPQDPPSVTKVIMDSLALRYASILRTVESLTSGKLAGVHVVGGGSRNDYLNQATAAASGLPVLAGPVEATVIGNVMVQAIAAGRFDSLAESRRYVASNVRLRRFEPATSPRWNAMAQNYAELERRWG